MQQPDAIVNEGPVNNVEARASIVREIALELVGPDNEIDIPLINETLSAESPLQRYKVGVLYPRNQQDLEDEAVPASIGETEKTEGVCLTDGAEKQIKEMQARGAFRY